MHSFVFLKIVIFQASLASQCQTVHVDQNLSSTHNAPPTIPQLSTFRPILDTFSSAVPVDQNQVPQHMSQVSLPTVPSAGASASSASGSAPPGPAEVLTEVMLTTVCVSVQ